MPGIDPPEFLKNSAQKYLSLPDIDMEEPSVARVYSYYLGGKDHFEADRRMARYAENAVPGVTDLALGNRAFVQRATRYMAGEAGLDQFLDIGSGLPTDGNVHEVAAETARKFGRPAPCVVYVDHDPIVLAHGRALLEADTVTSVVRGDLTDAGGLLAAATGTGLLDLDRPVALVLGGILHHLAPSEDPAACSKAILDALPSGSHVAISHFHCPTPEDDAEGNRRAVALQRAFLESLGKGWWRSAADITEYFHGWELVEPGLAPLNDWRPAESGVSRGTYTMPARNRALISGGVARKP
ncbi:SAM-dependent methyltransferase [Nocardiopsis coralliicola]